MIHAEDRSDIPEPPCFCGWHGPADQVSTTREFCPACGDPDKPAPEPPEDRMTTTCSECNDTGIVYFDTDTPGTPHYCGGCSGYPGIAHEPTCGMEPCPNDCPVAPPRLPPMTSTPTVRPSGHDPGCDQASKPAERKGTRT